jgi:hypothetical protein
VESLTRTGLEVPGGFIVGVDTDGPDIFDRQLAFISGLPLPQAMVGILGALPGTALWRRLEREGRLRPGLTGDQFGRPNFQPVMDEAALLAGYRRLLASVYTTDAYYDRCTRHIEQATPLPTPWRRGALGTLLRVAWGIGVRSPRRRALWRLVARALWRGPLALARADEQGGLPADAATASLG